MSIGTSLVSRFSCGTPIVIWLSSVTSGSLWSSVVTDGTLWSVGNSECSPSGMWSRDAAGFVGEGGISPEN